MRAWNHAALDGVAPAIGDLAWGNDIEDAVAVNAVELIAAVVERCNDKGRAGVLAGNLLGRSRVKRTIPEPESCGVVVGFFRRGSFFDDSLGEIL